MATQGAYFETTGTYGYKAGVDGTPTLPASSRVQRIWAQAGASGGTIVVNGGDSLPIAANAERNMLPGGAFSGDGATVVFTGTVSYLVEYLT